MSDPVLTERVKLTAAYLNTAAGRFFTTGVVAPLAAVVFGVAGPSGGPSALTLVLGVLIFLLSSLGLHAAARFVLKGVAP